MYLDLIYVLQRKTIARKMHTQVNKLYLHDHQHPYLKNVNDLRPIYVYRMKEMRDILDDAVRSKALNKSSLERVIFEYATNPCGQLKFSYADIVDLRSVIAEYELEVGAAAEEQAKKLYGCAQNIMPRIPDLVPVPESAAEQIADMHEVVEWQMFTYNYTLEEIIRYTDTKYLETIMYSFRNCVHPKVPHMSDYAMNIDAVIYSSMRTLAQRKYKPDDTNIVYWCCMYLRYCSPGFLDCSELNKDAYSKTINVLNILHNEWKYLQSKYK